MCLRDQGLRLSPSSKRILKILYFCIYTDTTKDFAGGDKGRS